MANFNDFVQYENIIMLLEPKDIASTITASAYMNLKGAHKAAFLVVFGAITSDTGTDAYVVTVEGATAEGGTEAAIAFDYRLSGALGTNTWGAVTSATTTGVSMDNDDNDNMMLWIEIDPCALAASDYNYVRVKITDSADMAAGLVTVLGILQPRYKMTTMVSTTASASS